MNAFSFGRNGVAARPPAGSVSGRHLWAKDESAPGVGDGTRIDAALVNDIVANLRAVLSAAGVAVSDPGANDKLLLAIEGLVYTAIAVRSAWSRGDWSAGEGYVAGEAVVYGGRIYISIEDHTSDAELPPGVDPESGANPFQILRWRGDWAAGLSYEVGDAVVHLATFYIASTAHVADVELQPGFTPGEGSNPFVLFGGGYLNASDYTAADVLAKLLGVDGESSGLDADLLDGQHASFFAPIESPGLTGNPTAPTQALDNNSTRLATTAFVQGVVAAAVIAAGTGDVSGPASSADGHAVLFDGTSGKSIKTSGAAPYLVGGTDVSVADGGTGASDAAGARTNLGLAINTDVQAYHALLAAIAGLTPTSGSFLTGNGTTFVMIDAAAARTALGLAALATKATINNADWSGTDLAIEHGGTGASTAAGARSNLGVAASSHGHSQSDITDLVAALAAKAAASIVLTAGTGLTGGGDLSGNRSFAVAFASEAEAEAGEATDKPLNALRVAQAIAAQALGVPFSSVSTPGTGSQTAPSGSTYWNGSATPTTSDRRRIDTATVAHAAAAAGRRLRITYQANFVTPSADAVDTVPYAVALFRDSESSAIDWINITSHSSGFSLRPALVDVVFLLTAADGDEHTYRVAVLSLTVGADAGAFSRRTLMIEEFASA